MTFIPRQERFTCLHCAKVVEPLQHGTYRNHCPACLYSLHVDDAGPGDRASECGGEMQPVGIEGTSEKGWILVHRCTICAKVSRNTLAPDDDRSTLEALSFEQNLEQETKTE